MHLDVETSASVFERIFYFYFYFKIIFFSLFFFFFFFHFLFFFIFFCDGMASNIVNFEVCLSLYENLTL